MVMLVHAVVAVECFASPLQVPCGATHGRTRFETNTVHRSVFVITHRFLFGTL